MGNYKVVRPVGFTTSDGDAMTCTTVGAVVDVDDGQAEELVANGLLERVKEPKPAESAKPKAKTES